MGRRMGLEALVRLAESAIDTKVVLRLLGSLVDYRSLNTRLRY